MKTVKYQHVAIQQTITADPVYRQVQVQLDPDYDICTGIAIIDHTLLYTGGGDIYGVDRPAFWDNLKFGIDNSAGTLISLTPEKLMSLSLEESKEAGRDFFMPIFSRARGENLYIMVSADKAESVYNYDVILRLEKRAELKANINDFQHIRFKSYPGTLLFETTETTLFSRYRKVKGLWLNSDYDFQARVGVKNTNGEYLMEPLIHKFLRKSTFVPYADRFFPVEFTAAGSNVKFEVELIQNVVNTTDVDIVLLLEK